MFARVKFPERIIGKTPDLDAFLKLDGKIPISPVALKKYGLQLEGVSNLSAVAFGDYFGRFSFERQGAISTKVYYPLPFEGKSAQKNPKINKHLNC